MSIELQELEQKLLAEIEEKLNLIKAPYARDIPDKKDVSRLVQEMGEKAHELHMSLKNRGLEPKHHAYMIKNRELEPDDEEFYMHVHPVEDLLAYIDDPHANDDPIDQTIDHEFRFTVFSPRWGHDDTYMLTRRETGWDVRFTHRGPCDKGGRPFLYSNFENDRVAYPAGLDAYLEILWDRASDQGLTHEAVQTALDELANWVKNTTRHAPSGAIWEGY